MNATSSVFEIIPAIDILDGKLVRLTQGDYGQVDTYETSPADMAKKFTAAGAKKIHIVDLNGAKDGKPVNLKTIESIRKATAVKLELGGGIRNSETAKAFFDAGIDLLVLGSLFVKAFDTAIAIVRVYPNRIVAGLDAKGEKVATEGWLETGSLTTHSLAQKLAEEPIPYIIYTDIAKDGMMAGPNVDSLQALAKASAIPVVASGGVRNLEDIAILRELHPKLHGCIIGKAILGGHLGLEKIWL